MVRVLLLLFLFGCDNRKDLGELYNGLPETTKSCSRDLVHQDRGVCIADGRKYRCIWTVRENDEAKWVDVSCRKGWW